MISDVYTYKPEDHTSATKPQYIKTVSHAMFKFCEHSINFHIRVVLQCCLLCKILHSLFNIWSLVWHKINVSCVCGTVWWELPFAFLTFFSGSSCIHSFMVIRKYKNQLTLKWKKNSFPKESPKGHIIKNHYLMKINTLCKAIWWFSFSFSKTVQVFLCLPFLLKYILQITNCSCMIISSLT